MEDLHKEFQAQVVDQDVDHRDDEIADDLGPPTQGGAAKADVTRHPEARQEGDGELEDESGDVRREGDEAQVEHLRLENEMVKHIVEHPFQGQVQATATAVTEQVQRHEFPKRRIEEVDDLGQQLLDAVFYVSDGSHL